MKQEELMNKKKEMINALEKIEKLSMYLLFHSYFNSYNKLKDQEKKELKELQEDPSKITEKIDKMIKYYDNKKPEDFATSALKNFNYVKKDIDKIYKRENAKLVKF